MVPCDRVRVRVPEPHVNVQEPHTDHSVHPTVVVATVISVVVSTPPVVSAPVAVSLNNLRIRESEPRAPLVTSTDCFVPSS